MKEKNSIKEKIIEALENREYRHGEKIILKHNCYIDYSTNNGKEECKGEVYWESVLEGFVCSKCDLYTGIK